MNLNKTVFILIIYPFRKYLFWTSNLMFAVINLRPQSSVTHDSNKQTNNFRRCNNPAFSRRIIRAKYHQMLRQCQSLTTHFLLVNPRNTAPWQQGPGRGTAPSADGVLWRPATVRGGGRGQRAAVVMMLTVQQAYSLVTAVPSSTAPPACQNTGIQRGAHTCTDTQASTLNWLWLINKLRWKKIQIQEEEMTLMRAEIEKHNCQ